MLLDLAILLTLALFAINGFRRGFLVLSGRLLILALSFAATLLMLGPSAQLLGKLPFVESLAETVNEKVIRPLMPVAGTLKDAVGKLELPQPVRDLLLAKLPNPDSPLLEAWPQLSGALADFAIRAVTFFVLLLLISLAVRTLVSIMTNILDHVPIVGFLNRLTGLLLGFLHGLLILVICILVAGFLAPYIPKLGAIMRESWIVTTFYRLDLITTWITHFLKSI